MAADRIALAQPAPAHCSSCYQQKPQQPHVDFGAGYDGPVVPALQGTVGVIGHSIDELILCEDCIRTAAKLIGYEDVRELLDKLETVEEARDVLHEKLQAAESHVEQLTAAVASKDQMEAVARPRPSTPKPPMRDAIKQIVEQDAQRSPKRRQSAADKAHAAAVKGEQDR